MIQLGTLRDKQGFKFNNLTANNLLDLFSNPDIANSIPIEERYNIFYTIAHHLKGKRKVSEKSFQQLDIIPFDIDEMDTSAELLPRYVEVILKAIGCTLDSTSVVFSGNGLHFLVHLDSNNRRGVFKKT